MIAKLTGLLDSVGTDWAVIDVNGVGYLVFASGRTLRALARVGEAVSVLIETHVREDHIHLYGFASTLERDWFRLLLTVQGVGAKVALAVLTALSPDELAQALASQDRTMLGRADGVGPKLALRLATELKDKASALALPAVLGAGSRPMAAAAAARSGESAALADAVSALVNLGYRRAEAFTAVATARARVGEGAGVSELIRLGLKELSA